MSRARRAPALIAGALPPAVADKACAAAGATLRRRVRAGGRRAGLALVYHRVAELEGDPANELVPALDRATFAAQMRHLRDHYDVVTASELPAAVSSRSRGAPLPVAVTFDDDLASHAAVAAPVLRGLGLPASFFLCGASLRAPALMWWEQLQVAWDRGIAYDLLSEAGLGCRGQDLHAAAAEIERMRPDRRRRIVDALREQIGPPPADAGMRAADVRRLAEDGFEIGFHTRRHDRLPPLGDDALARALEDGRGELEQAAGSALHTIAYPHGGADERVAEAARRAGWLAGFTTTHQTVRPDSDALALGRWYPDVRSLARFELQVARALR